jgi:integrase
MGKAKAQQISRPTANRYLALVRAVLRQAAGPWQWIDKAPAVTLYPEAKRRVRWLNKEEVSRLLNALPRHQRQLARFALTTGLRQANMLGLQWSDIDLARRTAWVHADQAKGGEAIGLPLNDEAMAVLQEEKGKHRERVFTFKGRPPGQVNTRSWRNALQRAGIKNFRWHDLRHVWATWHVMAGTTIAELQELGRVEVGADGQTLCAVRARATAKRCEQAGHIFGHTWVRGERGSTHNVLIDLAPRIGQTWALD